MVTTYAFPTHDLVSSYVLAKREVIRAGHIDEIVWQQQARLENVDQICFTREAAWVVLSAGMSERIVRRHFEPLGALFHHWDPYKIAEDDAAIERALTLFGHRGKIKAIGSIAATVTSLSTPELRRLLREDCRNFLIALPYIGPVTWAHLAKNLGVQIAKSDRHLLRMSQAYGLSSVSDLCSEIGSWLNEPAPVVDLVLWRYAVLHADFCTIRSCAGLPHQLPVGTVRRQRAENDRLTSTRIPQMMD